MADKDIIQNLIAQLGQSQAERMPAELDVHFIDVDERTTGDLLAYVRELANAIRYYPSDGSAPSTWAPFFNYNDAAYANMIAQNDGNVPPHMALMLAFLELYKKPQAIMNGITGRHLDFYYRDILRLAEKAAVPDKAHVVVELKKGASPVLLGPGNAFNAGKDVTGAELVYTPVREAIINTSFVDSLRSTYMDRAGHGTIRHAPIANSADGLGAKLKGDEPKWFGFGGKHLPPGELGFAIASPVLRMKEGRRTVRIRLTLGNLDASRLSASALQHAFDVFITCDKKWQGPIPVTPALGAAMVGASTVGAGNVLELQFTMEAGDPAVIDYDAAVHGYAYSAQAPVAQVLLRSDNPGIGYLDFENLTLQRVEVLVDVTDIKSLALESDAGTLDSKKAFMPFGSQPTAGSRFMVGNFEALTKKLSQISLTVQWKDIPAGGNLQSYYTGYGVPQASNSYFTANVEFKDGSGHEYSVNQNLFETSNASLAHEIVFTPTTRYLPAAVSFDSKIYALAATGGIRALREANSYVLRMPVYAAAATSPAPLREGYITFALNTDFLHATYRRRFMENILAASKPNGTLAVLNEPYTPTVQSIALAYSAHSDVVNVGSATLDDFAAGDVQFYHITPSGPRREHGYLRRQLDAAADKAVTVLPAYSHEGELLIGLANLNPGDSVSLLFQVAEGSADPELEPQPVEWYVMCDNYWKRLGHGELALNTTNGLLASGLVTIVIPADATTHNTVLPTGHIWIRAAVRRQVAAVSQLIAVEANALEVRFADNGNDPAHLLTALPAKSIARLKVGVSAVKTITQPYASFGGSATEASGAFHTRVAERLRHKDRCITPWDYERVVLETFPRVHRVKCIPHAKEGSWRAPGNVMIVVVPDLRNKNALDPLEPRLDAGTIDRITDHVQAHAGMHVRVKVKNPRYQKIRVEFKVRLYPGYEFNYYRNLIEQELIRVLSPWAFDANREITFGGTIYKSVLLDVVEDLPYVDYITDFKMYSYAGDTNNLIDRNEAHAETPDMVLVSDAGHTIVEIPV